jgi:hypothetical protein
LAAVKKARNARFPRKEYLAITKAAELASAKVSRTAGMVIMAELRKVRENWPASQASR